MGASEGVYEIVPMQECKDAGKKLFGVDLGGHRQLCGSRSQEISIETVCQGIQDEEARPDSKTSLASQLFAAMPPLESVQALVSIMMSVGWSNKSKPLNLRHYDISRAHFLETAQRLIYIRHPAEDRQK